MTSANYVILLGLVSLLPNYNISSILVLITLNYRQILKNFKHNYNKYQTIKVFTEVFF